MKAVIIEDEEIIAAVLKKKISEAAPDVDIIATLPSLKTATRWFTDNREPDLLFMDIQLSDGVSFDLLKKFTLDCPIIFTTAYDEYALQAFKVNGVDYLLKPVDVADLKRAVDKCRKINGSHEPPADITEMMRMMTAPNKKLYKERLLVNMRHQMMPVNVNDIACIVRDTLTYVYLFTGAKYIIDYNVLDELEQLLNPDIFYRANRQTIIHVNSIHTMKSLDNAKLSIRLKEPNHKLEIDMSREKSPAFKRWLDR